MSVRMLPQQYCLRWKHHHSNVQNMFSQLLEKERFCDVTLYCSPSFASQLEKGDAVDPNSFKGVSLRAHRVVLASCSELLGALLAAHEASGEPLLVIDGADPDHVRALLAYMYTGEMNVPRSQLQGLLKTAEELKVKGLTDIRWNNKDEPPDCQTDAVTATATASKSDTTTLTRNSKETAIKVEDKPEKADKFSVNGGPPPLIKLPSKDKISTSCSPPMKREAVSDGEDQECKPKRNRMPSGMENSDDEEREEWRHGNMDITAERVVGWGAEDSEQSWTRDEEDWADAPADIGSFLHTRLRVDGDQSAEESNDEAPPSTSSSVGTAPIDLPNPSSKMPHAKKLAENAIHLKPTIGPKSGPTDPRFTDVVKLNDYLRHGRRPQFWEEDYVKRVMESIRLKELEMKQAAEILGVSYGTLYGRYRDAYGCINRPFRTARDLWSSKGATEVLDRLRRGDIPLEVAAQALGVSSRDLYVHAHDLHLTDKEFEPIPIEIDPSLRMKSHFSGSSLGASLSALRGKRTSDDGIPATVIAKPNATAVAAHTAGRWRLNLDPQASSSSTSPAHDASSPTLLMKSRPDLTIIAAKKEKNDEENGT